MNGLSALYAKFVGNTRYDFLEQDLIQKAKMLILDLVGVSFAGYRTMEFPRVVIDYMASLGGVPEATIIQKQGKFPAINAAFVNAACAHAIDMDDGHRLGAVHPGTVIIPSAIAAGELRSKTTKEVITGIIVGYEVMTRIGMAINPSSLNRGFHSTGITGTFGAAAASANVMGLSHQETVGAFGLAGLQSSGLIVVNHDAEGAKVKPLNPGKAAMAGLLSCILAKKGIQGPLNIFEGQDGFLQAVTDEVKSDLLVRDLGRRFEIAQTYIKFYACCRHAHACIDAALGALNKARINHKEISKISINTYPSAIRLAGITNVTTPSAARFSIPFSVALALIRQDAGADQYTEENVKDKSIQDLAKKVHLSVGRKWEKLYPEKRGATVTIKSKNNNEWYFEVELAKGEPEDQVSWDQVEKKFYTNATLLISYKKAEKIVHAIKNFDIISLDEFARLLR